MIVGLDTSVVVRLLVGEPAEQAQRARSLLDARMHAGQAPVWLSALVISEAYFALRHHYHVPANEALIALRALVADARVQTTPAVQEVLQTEELERARPGFMDRLIHADYRSLGATLVSFDRDLGRLADVQVLP